MYEHLYPYVTEDNRENKQFYMYSTFHGFPFIQAYKESRDLAFRRFQDKVEASSTDEPNVALVNPFLFEIGYDVTNDNSDVLDKWIHSFEIRKRVYSAYDIDYRPLDTSDYKDSGPYVRLASAIALKLHDGGGLKYLNTLLKLVDTILSFEAELSNREIEIMLIVLAIEKQTVMQLQTAKGLGV
ncbi:hypothetical protein [Cohnella panacarvi]|uniref:hypothetical protein n=1 Tax=Cohnella panacarvi TaxID=400776 RepID=UPI00047DB5B7|nr:hypothetical protein [Cohnella panacarvi]